MTLVHDSLSGRPNPVLQFTPRRLEVFVAVVDNAGFGAAATALNISQPSVSVHIQALERQVGAPLFDRVSGQAPRLNESGRTLYAYARDMLTRARLVTTELGQTANRLCFGAQRSVTSLLRRPLETFAAQYPDVELIARSGTFEEVSAQFASGSVDLVFMLSSGEVPGLQTSPLGRYRLAFVAAPHHPLSTQSDISPLALAQHPFVWASLDSYFGRTLTALTKAAGIPPLTIRSQADEWNVLREMTLAGLGLCIALRRSVQKDLAAGTLIELDVDTAPMYLRLNYARNPRAHQPQIEALVQMVERAEAQVHANS